MSLETKSRWQGNTHVRSCKFKDSLGKYSRNRSPAHTKVLTRESLPGLRALRKTHREVGLGGRSCKWPKPQPLRSGARVAFYLPWFWGLVGISRQGGTKGQRKHALSPGYNLELRIPLTEP